MEHLGIPPGPLVGKALAFLLEIRLDEGEIGHDEAMARLDQWWKEQRRVTRVDLVRVLRASERPCGGAPHEALGWRPGAQLRSGGVDA